MNEKFILVEKRNHMFEIMIVSPELESNPYELSCSGFAHPDLKIGMILFDHELERIAEDGIKVGVVKWGAPF